MKNNYFIFVCISFFFLVSCTTEVIDTSEDSPNQDNDQVGFIQTPGGNIAKEIPSEIFNMIISDLENKSEYLKIEKLKENYVLDNENFVLNKNVILPPTTRASSEFEIEYRSHIAGIGWTAYSSMGEITGTVGLKKKMEALEFRYKKQIIPISDFKVRAHVGVLGWLPWVVIGDVVGTTGASRQMEAVQINVSSSYNIYYRAHVGVLGWLAYVNNGEVAGTVGQLRQMEAFQLFMFKY